MATKVPQRTPWEPLLDANRTQEFTLRVAVKLGFTDLDWGVD